MIPLREQIHDRYRIILYFSFFYFMKNAEQAYPTFRPYSRSKDWIRAV